MYLNIIIRIINKDNCIFYMKRGDRMKCSVVARDRTVYVDDSFTIRETIDYLASKGLEISLRRTLQSYGLRYTEERSFFSRYKSEFNLSDKKTMYDIKLKELKQHRDILVGYPIRMR